jgi:hypothetical protein
MDFRPEELMVIGGIDMCAGWLGALLFIVVGFVSVRGADKKAGLAVGGSGALLLLTGCCAYWGSFYMEAVGYDAFVENLFPLSIAFGSLCRLIGYGGIIFGAVTVAMKATKSETEPGAAP